MMVSFSSWSSALAEENRRKWDLTSPEKIFWAVSWLKSTTRGRDSADTKAATPSSVISSVRTALPSSKVLTTTTASPSTPYSEQSPVIPKGMSSMLEAAARKALAASVVSSLKHPRTATVFPSTKVLTASASARAAAGGPVFFSTQLIMVSAVLPPPYSMGLPFLKNLRVGYPRTSNFSANFGSSVASTLPSLTAESFSARRPAALAYSGARALQWPHHGA